MTNLEKACQVLLVGFEGTTLDASLADTFRTAQFGGYLLFARNIESIEQTRALTDALRALHPADAPPLIAVDQEGGRVVRLRDSVEPIPPMMALGATGDIELAGRVGEQIAHELRRAGFGLDFAPVLDLALDPANTVIGTRSFGRDPVRVAALGGALAEGLQRGGVVATFKHFPGHGSTAVDSHLDLPVIALDSATLRARDLAPFALLARSARAVMSAHVVMEAVDPNNPATLSRAALTELLRGELGFDGVCFTDCMQMGAIAAGGTENAVVRALAAGADCALVSHDPALALRAARNIVDAVDAGTLPSARLKEAAERVAQLRRFIAPPQSLDAPAPFAGIGRTVAEHAVTLVRGDAHAIPAQSIVVSFESATTEGAQGHHEGHPSLGEHAPGLAEARVPLEPSLDDVQRVCDEVARSARRPIVLSRRSHIYASQAAAIHALLKDAPEALLISVREPFDIALFPEAKHVLAAYGDDVASITGLATVIFGSAYPTGRLPVDL